MGRIVVGIDGSPHSRRALRWAVEEAALRGARVEAIMTWHEPYLDGTWALPVSVDLDGLEKSYRTLLDEIVDGTDARALSEPIERILIRGGAAGCLLDAATGADMVVVGSRGHGGFMGLILGSVSHQVASHATCPVVIIHGAEPDE